MKKVNGRLETEEALEARQSSSGWSWGRKRTGHREIQRADGERGGVCVEGLGISVFKVSLD